MNITYRDYTPEDKNILLELTKSLNGYIKNLDPLQRIKNYGNFSELSLKETLTNVKKYQGKILMAEDDNKVVGYIVGVIWKQSNKNKLEIGEHKLGEVIDLYVEQSYRGKGLGSHMLNLMQEYFKNMGCDSMWIEVFAPNQNAYKIYKKFGFVEREIGMLKQLGK